MVKERRILPLFDSAYLGITSGSYAADAFAIRYFVDELGLETIVCASFAKNMGLYGKLAFFSWKRMAEPAICATSINSMDTDWSGDIYRRARWPCLYRHQVCQFSQGRRVQIGPNNSGSHLQPASLWCANSSGHSRGQPAARTVGPRLGHDEQPHCWHERGALQRVGETRYVPCPPQHFGIHYLCISRLKGTPGDWKRILEQKGMFCILGLNLEKVLELRGTSYMGASDGCRLHGY